MNDITSKATEHVRRLKQAIDRVSKEYGDCNNEPSPVVKVYPNNFSITLDCGTECFFDKELVDAMQILLFRANQLD